ncbi:hypothetical protein RhiLY_11269 [Ceratobasidium sp. AG-Ba]|nr:hypothetical protein RhiLY_11269 [Ceratobasidium sp. AG-Ba]
MPFKAGPSRSILPSAVKPKRHSCERDFHRFETLLSDCLEKLTLQGEEIGYLRDKLGQAESSIEELTIKFDRYREAQAMKWAQAKSVVASTGPVPAMAPPSSTSGSTGGDKQRTMLTSEQAATPDLIFDPRTNTNATVPVSDIKTLKDLVIAYKSCPKVGTSGFPAEAQIRTHLRNIIYGVMDGVEKASEVKPPYISPDGSHMLFRPELADPETSYVKAYPLFELGKLKDQIPFLERVLQRFRSTAPQNDSAFSIMARTLREDLLVENLMSGVWRTCCRTHQDMVNKTPDVIEARKKLARKVATPCHLYLSRTTAGRLINREHIPELAGMENDAIFNEGMMSEEESEGEGLEKVLVVKRPSYRSTREREGTGNSFQTLSRIVRTVNVNQVPERTKNQGLIVAKDYRPNTNLTKFPDIDHFLLQHRRTWGDHPTLFTNQPAPEQLRAKIANEDLELGAENDRFVQEGLKGGESEEWVERIEGELGVQTLRHHDVLFLALVRDQGHLY